MPECYPSVFALVSEVLDSFGKLVFERLKNKSIEHDSSGRVITNLRGLYHISSYPWH